MAAQSKVVKFNGGLQVHLTQKDLDRAQLIIDDLFSGKLPAQLKSTVRLDRAIWEQAVPEMEQPAQLGRLLLSRAVIHCQRYAD